jgi:hypothetical protein
LYSQTKLLIHRIFIHALGRRTGGLEYRRIGGQKDRRKGEQDSWRSREHKERKIEG